MVEVTAVHKNEQLAPSREFTNVLDTVSSDELTLEEEKELLYLERTIERSFYEAGKALKQIRDHRLYRWQYKNFECYCQQRFGINRISAYNKIVAANTFENLFTNGEQVLPNSERQVRPIVSLEPALQCEIWHRAVQQAGGKVPSGRIVRDIVQQIREKTPVPNPFRPGQVCQIVTRGNPDLKGRGGCWAIVQECGELSCTVRLWDTNEQVSIQNLKSWDLSPGEQKEVKQICTRLTKLCGVENLDRSAYVFLKNLGKQSYLTPVEEKLLATLEQHYSNPPTRCNVCIGET